MCLPFQFDLPDSFIRQYRPVRVRSNKSGLSRYLFDTFGLDLHCKLATAKAVPSNAIWSVRVDPSSAFLVVEGGYSGDAIGYIVTDAPREPSAPSVCTLPRRLSYHQKLRLTVLRALLAELCEAQLPLSSEIIAFIEERAREGA